MTPAEELRAAAEALRLQAKLATDGPWTCSPVWSPDSPSTSGVYSQAHPTGTVESEVVASGRVKRGYGGIRNPHNAVWITLMQPAIAEPLALMLDAEADRWETETGTWTVDCAGCSTGRRCSGEHVEARSHVGHCERLFQAPIDENRGADWRCDCFDPAIDAARAVSGGGS